MTTTAFTVTGMTCSSCERHVREEVSAIAGLTVTDVSAALGTLEVSADAPIDTAAVIAAVAEAGYTAVPAS